jgi:N-acetylglucosaminyldiphosphoundecaprenol N-acetyl-beta-D-mannosaminyltransferase
VNAATEDLALRTCGVRVDPLSMDVAVEGIALAAVGGRPMAVHLVNAYTLSLAVRDERFRGLLDRGDLNLPDGTPLVWIGRRAGLDGFTSRVYGPDLTVAVCDRGRAHGLRHYLYGASPEVVERFAQELRRRFPGIEIVGVESPPFRPLRDEEEAELVERIRAAGAHLVWVGLGTPKQDHFVDRFRDRVGIPLLAVGAAFDFLAGEKKMAPRWMQERGLEWLYRLLSEPRRLWKRYLIGNLVFLRGAVRGARVEPAPVRPWDRGGSAG